MDYRSLHPRKAHEIALLFDSLYLHLRVRKQIRTNGSCIYYARREIARTLAKMQNKQGDREWFGIEFEREFKRRTGFWSPTFRQRYNLRRK